jgi:Protein of unknown function (DUF2442)
MSFAWHGRKFMGSLENFSLANERGKEIQSSIPRAVSARYDSKTRRVEIQLSTNLHVSFSPRDAQGLEKATPSQLQEIEISPSGFGIHFPKLDADLYLPAILQGFLGSRKWMASRLGHAGGKSRSIAKRKASRANGKLGGRPRKVRRGGL